MLSLLKTKRTKTIITILLCIFSLFCLSTIAYSAFSATMNITGLAHSRVEADVRITNFSLDQIVNATSSYEEFGKNTISSSITLEENGYVIYKIEVTNYGNTNVGIYDITGFPENITYEIIDYKLQDEICNINGKCNNYATKVFYIKFSGNNISKTFTLNFDFRLFHELTYINFEKEYQSAVIDDGSLSIDLTEESPKFVSVYSTKYIEYNYENNILNVNNVTSPLTIEAIDEYQKDYSYTGNTQNFTVPYDGLYKIELWGAQGGGDSTYPGGKGGYTAGEIYLNKNDTLYIQVGQNGNPTSTVYNNGASTKYYSYSTSYGYAYSGGGGTDVRIASGNWYDFESIKSRIMVASAGGGSNTYHSKYSGGAGGGLTGYSGTKTGTDGSVPTGGEQTQGGVNGGGTHLSSLGARNLFGVGLYYKKTNSNALAAGGGGYYFGGNSPHGGSTTGSAAGGSSFISGHNGCDAIEDESTENNIIHTGQSSHYSTYIFKNTKMIDGQGYSWTTSKGSQTGMPTHDGTTTMNGNTGDGYAKITLLDTKVIYDIRYIDIEGEYPTTIEKGKDLIVDFGDSPPPKLKISKYDEEFTDYSYVKGILIIKNVSGSLKIENDPIIYSYEYTGDVATFTVPANAIYKIELWGAQGGGDSTYIGGYGAYTSGNIKLIKDEQLYVYVGEYGANTNTVFNNGASTSYIKSAYGYAGGGSTDIRTVSGSWDNFDSLKSRIMVASSGSGASAYFYQASGVAGGGLTGYSGTIKGTDGSTATGATQTIGGKNGKGANIGTSFEQYNKFGIVLTSTSRVSSAGNGYYAGGNGAHGNNTVGIAASGSSFISGHDGCDAIDESSTESNIIHTGQSNHYSNYIFTDTKMIDGQGYSWTTSKGSKTGMPTHDGRSTMTGNIGNGYAKITLIELK